MIADKNRIIPGKHGKEILLDIFYVETGRKKPVVIFAHGFKGFKDWGHFNRVAARFAEKGFVFIKFNFSHNGTTTKKPTEFADLTAFGQNNYTIEQDDLGCVIDELERGILLPEEEFDMEQAYLLGHSRGGAMVIIKANEDERIKKVATWAAVSFIGTQMGEDQLKKWEKKGVVYVPNSRTGQNMPMYWQLVEDFRKNEERFNVVKAASNLKIPLFVVHGTRDETVPFKEAQILTEAAPKGELFEIDGASHTFGGSHPYINEMLPLHAQIAVDKTIAFFKR